MAEILHALRIDAPPSRVFAALTDPSSLRGFWAGLVTARATLDSLVGFRVDPEGNAARMRVARLDDDASPEHTPQHLAVTWRCIEGPEGWAGTQVTVELEARPSRVASTLVRLRHAGWSTPSDGMGLSSVWWARFLFALKRFAETPEPEDLYV